MRSNALSGDLIDFEIRQTVYAKSLHALDKTDATALQ